MNILKNIFLFKKNFENNKGFSLEVVDQYDEIAKFFTTPTDPPSGVSAGQI